LAGVLPINVHPEKPAATVTKKPIDPSAQS
jgi:hypothetical protein